jgi:DeoR/GlpR family transcriptional regulator of sugar metabolism
MLLSCLSLARASGVHAGVNNPEIRRFLKLHGINLSRRLEENETKCLLSFAFSAILKKAGLELQLESPPPVLAEERRNRLLELVRVRRFASLPELAEQLEVSESTVRRDVESLEEQGTARRIHGGVLYAGNSPKLPHFDVRQPAQWELKRAIAEKAVALIDDDDTVLMDGGSTTYEVARLLLGRSLHVVTNSLPVANLFAADTNSDLVLIGGNICPRSGVTRGPYADEMLGRVRVRKTVMSTAAVSDEGLFNNNLLLIETERAMMRAADQVIVVVDSTKFGHQSLGHVCPLQAVHHFVVDSHLSEAWQNKIIAAGVDLLVADVTANTPSTEPRNHP